MSEYLCLDNIVSNSDCRSYHSNISPWLDEQIWGHRIWDGQSPWLIILEFLTVAEACLRENRLFDEGGVHYPLRFRPYQRLYLRNVLFNNEFVDSIDKQCSNSEAWEMWTQQMNAKAQGVPVRDFSYLKNKFSSFCDFATIVRTLRGTAVESNTNRRWSSRFVFPFGPAGLYEDLNIKYNSVSREYINFGRTGELLYLMLCRSKSAKTLRAPVQSLFENNHLNKLLKCIQPRESNDLQSRGYSYLPYIRHQCFDILGEDWNNICSLKLSGFDAYQYLVILSAFHILLYQLNTATWFMPNSSKVHFICEVIAPQKNLIRELSISNYQQNNVLTTQAVDEYLSRITVSNDWLVTTENSNEADAFLKCRQILQDKLWWPPFQSDNSDRYDGPSNPIELLKQLREIARKRHQQHAGNVHRTYGRAIGLISRRGTNRHRYAPDDIFLKSLVVANVENRREFNKFLADLYDRYGLIFGEREASSALSSNEFDQKVFQANTERLERRLASMGMLRRLSDACAFVINPFSKVEQ